MLVAGGHPLLVAIPAPNLEDGSDKVSPSRLQCLEELRQELSCGICLDVCRRPTTTTCGHNFCVGCLQQALEADWQGRCPKCRAFLPNRGQLAVNTTLWNTIQLLFPHAAAAPGRQHGPAPEPAAPAVGVSSQALAQAGRPATLRVLPAQQPSGPTGLDDLLEALSLAGSSAAAARSQPGGGTSSSSAATQRPWARRSSSIDAAARWPQPSSSSAASQPAAAEPPVGIAASQPGAIPSSLPQPAASAAVRGGNPFVRTAGAQGRPGLSQRGSGSWSSSRASSAERVSERAAPVAADLVAALSVLHEQRPAAIAAVVDLTQSDEEDGDDESLEEVPASPDAMPAGLPAGQQQAAGPGASRSGAQTGPRAPAGAPAQPAGAVARVQLAVSVPPVTLREGEEDDTTPPAQIVPVHAPHPQEPMAPARKASRSRLAPSLAAMPTY